MRAMGRLGLQTAFLPQVRAPRLLSAFACVQRHEKDHYQDISPPKTSRPPRIIFEDIECTNAVRMEESKSVAGLHCSGRLADGCRRDRLHNGDEWSDVAAPRQ